MQGIYALLAEWRALTDSRTEPAAAQIKIDWWQGEVERLAAGRPSHPIGLFLLRQPRAPAVDFSPLMHTVAACRAQITGVPLEHAADLAAHSDALCGEPLLIASRLGSDAAAEVGACTRALAVAQYLAHALADYRRDAAIGRVVFAIDALLDAGVEDADLQAAKAPVHLQSYLDDLTRQALDAYAAAAQALTPAAQPSCRHLAVLAAVGRGRLQRGPPQLEADFQWRDLYNAWIAARRAAAGRC